MATYLSDQASYRALKRALDTGAVDILMELTGAETEREAREQARRLCREYRKNSARSVHAVSGGLPEMRT